MRILPCCGAFSVALLACPAIAQPIEEVQVRATHDTRTIDILSETRAAPDIAALLRAAPGASINRNGPLTGIPQYRGMYGPRIAVSLDGHALAPAGPNWMDPPLSYAVTAQLESLEVYRGIAPVSVAQEAIGGAIDARKRHRAFGTTAELEVEGQVAAMGRSVDGGYQLDAELQASNEHHRLKLASMLQRGEDADFPGGEILPSRYQRQRYDLGYGFRWGKHQLQLDFGRNEVDDSGTPALPMDIDYFDGDLYDLNYQFRSDSGLLLGASLYGRDLDHGMSNYLLRPLAAPAMARRNIATSDNLGFKLHARWGDSNGHWGVGVDGFRERHDSDIDNPNMAPFFVVNFNRAEREVLGLYLEREQALSRQWHGEFGLRLNRVRSDAGEVNGTPAMMMPPATMLRDRFNAADREQREGTTDIVARLHYRSSDHMRWYLGLARKQRSPSYQERYLWLPLEATGGLADGLVYIGDIELDPETARSVELGLDYNGARLSLSPRLFYQRIADYIQGTPLDASHPATRMVRMMNASNGTRRPDPLQFANVEAALYGLDMDWRLVLDGHWSLSGLLNLVYGERRDIRDDLYRIAPPNLSLRLQYAGADWSVSAEAVGFAAQERVSETNRERATSGYGLINLQGQWQPLPAIHLSAGVENLLDRRYQPHLGGYNRVANPDVAIGERLPGYGRSLFARVSYSF